MRVLAAILVAAALGAAGSSAGSTSTGLYGVVKRGPTKPVCELAQPCEAPAAHVRLRFTRGGRAVVAKTDAAGRYRVALAPGRWAVAQPGPVRLGRALAPARVAVHAGGRARVDFSIDTGIR